MPLVALAFPGAPGPRRRARRGAAAFSLLEVLVALAIFAMGFIVILATYANVLNSYEGIRRNRESDEDVKFARATLLAETDLQKAEDGEEFDSTGGRHVRWTSTIEPSATMPDLFAVTFNCEITESGQGEPQKTSQTFMVLRPTWSDATDRDKLLQDIKARIAELQGKQPNGFVAASPAPAGGGLGGGGRGGRGAGGGGGAGGAGGRGGRGGRNGGGGNGLGPGNGDGTGGAGPPGGGGFQRGGGGNPGGQGAGGRVGGQGGGGQPGGGGAAGGANQPLRNTVPAGGGGR